MHRYPFLRFAAGALRVLGWIALVVGVIGSIGAGVMAGMTVEGMVELPFVNIVAGAMVIIVGMIGSFVVWLFLLSARELFLLAIDVEQNTRDTVEWAAERSI
ncbi:MAG: hypothetical protein ACNA7X_02320 [Dehalococcoidia bacterium]